MASMTPPRKPGLDLVRSLAILLVLAGHGALLLPPEVIEAKWRARLLYAGGYFGVELFFVLSGCLVVGLLFRLLEREPQFGWLAALGFMRRRWWRTLPTYFLFLLLNATLFVRWFGGEGADWRYLLFLQSLAWPHPAFMAEAWSLAVEEWFYLLLPVCLMLVLPRFATGHHAVLAVLLGMVVVLGAARLGLVALLAPAWDEGLRKVALLRLDAVAWGGLVAYALRYHRPLCQAWAGRLLCLGVLLMLVMGLWLLHGVDRGFSPVLHYAPHFTLTSLAAALCLPAASLWQCLRGRLAAAVTWVSQVSYSTYLLHFSLVIPLLSLPAVQEALPLAWRLLLYPALSLGLAWGVYRGFEMPMTQRRERLSLWQRLEARRRREGGGQSLSELGFPCQP